MVYSFSSSLAAEPVRISVREGSCAVAIGEEAGFSFDGEGRLLTATLGDFVHKRGLNHKVVRKWHDKKRRHTEELSAESRGRILLEVQERLGELAGVLPADIPDQIRTRLLQAATWNEERYRIEEQAFAQTYKPIGILPPDQYMALVVQATEGCHYNRCTFCQFYRETPFRVKELPEFRSHLNAVVHLVGRATSLRRSVFLADANALVASHRRLVELFSVVNETFAFAPQELEGRDLREWLRTHPEGKTGIYSFMDAFTGFAKPASEFAELGEKHLKRIYIGMESGHVPLLDFLEKPSKPERVTEVVSSAKEGGVNVGLIVMTGIGGHEYAKGHVDDTVSTLNRLPLGQGDLVYLSPFKEDPNSEYAGIARDADLKPLAREEGQTQATAIRAGLKLAPDVKVAVYDVEEFVY